MRKARYMNSRIMLAKLIINNKGRLEYNRCLYTTGMEKLGKIKKEFQMN